MKKACIIGWPVAHSRSPLIHGHWLRRYGIDGEYVRHGIPDAAALAAFIAALPSNGLAGCNVTVPHKAAVMACVDTVDDKVRAIGAANTLWLDNGKIHATNTDVDGFLTHLSSTCPDWPRDRPAVVLGAGGAARAVVYGLLMAGVPQVRLVNRGLERARALAEFFGAKVVVDDWSHRTSVLSEAGLLVNTTILGMKGHPPLEIELNQLDDTAVVYDIVYSPLETALLERAGERGLRTVDGLGMLLHQAVPGFERWFGRRPEVTAELRAELIANLEQK